MNKIFIMIIALFSFYNHVSAKELDEVRKSEVIRCGVVNNFKGVSYKDSDNKWSGFFPDICKAVAVAIFNDENKLKFIELSEKELEISLKSGKVDIIVAPLPIKYNYATEQNMSFSYPFYFDSMTFAAKKSAKINKLAEANKLTLCTYQGYPFEERLDDYIEPFKDKIILKKEEDFNTAFTEYQKGSCDIIASTGINIKVIERNTESNILSDNLVDVAYGIAVNDNDENLLKIASWAFYATVIATEMEISSKNIKYLLNTEIEEIELFINNESGKVIGSSSSWLYNIIEKVGNYTEIYDRNLGKNSDYNFESKRNKIWREKGALFAPLLN